ncbi:hypothetical protein BS47DRAFT_1290905 [Hydnum rufescens UP504]|uniref:protein-tyrosine-phosphatase n=1 Tax=Hydnum rufescens UP504 TaxID=1448309 RepID=A0A9P6B4F8_9AGAM|nr:hypothetical protein BS47DRAFT_1290905 [Hydnum rufescens UP504]
MDEVIPGLWIGDISAAVAQHALEQNNIKFVLSAMRGRVKVNPLLQRHQIPLDDVPTADILEHIPACNALIEAALARNDGVLVHCQAGMSRSVAIVAGFLMYSLKLDRDAALELIRKVRPSVAPNEGFMQQLDIFHDASFKVTRADKSVRNFYMDRSVREVLNGDASEIRTDMFAGFPRTPSASAPATPGGPHRRIRCKACRRELAAREHMIDHGQLSPPTPIATPQEVSRASSFGETSDVEPSRSRRPSRSGSFTESSRPGALGGLTMSSVSSIDTDGVRPGNSRRSTSFSGRISGFPGGLAMTSIVNVESAVTDSDEEAAGDVAEGDESPNKLDDNQAVEDLSSRSTSPLPSPPILLSPSEISAQLPTSLAALRRSSLLVALNTSTPTSTPSSLPISRSNSMSSPRPILVNASCSGYFIEPMKWMDPFLQDGHMAGKITCPNERCNSKLGNYDWAGVECGCKTWVTPGFCISRSKVDEVS